VTDLPVLPRSFGICGGLIQLEYAEYQGFEVNFIRIVLFILLNLNIKHKLKSRVVERRGVSVKTGYRGTVVAQVMYATVKMVFSVCCKK